MRNTRRLATIGLSVIAAGALLAGTAAADSPATVTAGDTGGTAQAHALTITVAGQTITGSAATASLDLTKTLAEAEGTQVLTPAFTSAPAHASVNKVGTDLEQPKTCTGSQATQVPGIGVLDITCGSAAASLTDAGGAARGLGAEVHLDLSASNVLSTLQLQAPAQQATSQLEQALNPLVQGLTGTPIGSLVTSADQTVQDVLSKILSLKTTARVVVAPALAEVTGDATTVTSHAHAQGVRIELLPVDGTNATNNLLPNDIGAGQPLITITIGNAECGKTVSRDNSFAAKVDCTAAVATVEFGSPTLAQALGVPSKIEVQGGQQLCIPGLTGTPLETCIDVASAGVDANGNPYANGVSIALFKGVNGGASVSTGQVTAGAAAAAPAAVAAPASATPDLPRTGGSPTLPLLGGALLAAALVTRRFALGRR